MRETPPRYEKIARNLSKLASNNRRNRLRTILSVFDSSYLSRHAHTIECHFNKYSPSPPTRKKKSKLRCLGFVQLLFLSLKQTVSLPALLPFGIALNERTNIIAHACTKERVCVWRSNFFGFLVGRDRSGRRRSFGFFWLGSFPSNFGGFLLEIGLDLSDVNHGSCERFGLESGLHSDFVFSVLELGVLGLSVEEFLVETSVLRLERFRHFLLRRGIRVVSITSECLHDVSHVIVFQRGQRLATLNDNFIADNTEVLLVVHLELALRCFELLRFWVPETEVYLHLMTGAKQKQQTSSFALLMSIFAMLMSRGRETDRPFIASIYPIIEYPIHPFDTYRHSFVHLAWRDDSSEEFAAIAKQLKASTTVTDRVEKIPNRRHSCLMFLFAAALGDGLIDSRIWSIKVTAI